MDLQAFGECIEVVAMQDKVLVFLGAMVLQAMVMKEVEGVPRGEGVWTTDGWEALLVC